eukprot:gene15948-22083_t
MKNNRVMALPVSPKEASLCTERVSLGEGELHELNNLIGIKNNRVIVLPVSLKEAVHQKVCLDEGEQCQLNNLIAIKNNSVIALPVLPEEAVHQKIRFMVDGLKNSTTHPEHALTFPDTAFLLNVWDQPRCPSPVMGRTPRCKVPIFSLIKQWDWEKNEGLQTDILVPFFNHFYDSIITGVPWESKSNKALMRAAMQNGMPKNCTREWLLELGQTPDGKRLLDVGITNNLKKGFKADIANYVNIPDHSRWKYLISADGFSASCRYGKLLQMDSVVLKEVSQWIEYYYRSPVPNKHFIPFEKDTIMDVLLDLEKRDQTAEGRKALQAVASQAQQFAYTYLSQHAKAMYMLQAVVRYNTLFSDLNTFVGSLTEEQLTSFENVRDAAMKYGL